MNSSRLNSVIVAAAVAMITIVLAALVHPAVAQQSRGTRGPAVRESCVEVEIAGEKSFSCLNQQMKREVDRANPAVNIAPLDARSPDTRIGVVNVPAVRQQYGKNFGTSVIPFRPAHR